MLTAAQFDQLVIPISDLYEQYNQSVINDIARRLMKMSGSVTETAAWQMQRLVESGMTYQNAIKEVAKLTGQSEEVLKQTFTEAGVKAMKFDDALYKAAGLNPLPLNLSPAMTQVLFAGLMKTNGVMRNLTMTTAIDAQNMFTSAADLAYLQVSSGAMSYDQAIRAAVKNMAAKGLSTIGYASGRKDQLDVAMRRTVLTGVTQTTGQLQMTRADEMGQDLVQTSAHMGARPEHQEWQGKVFSRSGTSKTYPDFVSSTEYGSITGLCGINCRHSFYPFFEGLSENAYSQAALDEYADATVKYNGQDVPMYDATQMQRAIERKLRTAKREAGALDAAGLDNSVEKAKVKDLQAQMRDFVKQTGLQRQPMRESVILAGGSSTPPVVVNTPPVTPTPAPMPMPISPAPSAPTPATQSVPSLQIPIADTFTTFPNNQQLESSARYGLQAVDQVLDVPQGTLSPIPIGQARSNAGYNGQFSYFKNNGKPYQILLKSNGPHPELTIIHELGHFIDMDGIGMKGGFASSTSQLSDWKSAVFNSQAYQDLKSIKAVGSLLNANGVRIPADIDYLNYVLTPKELFARSFAQYISTKSGDTILLQQLDNIRAEIGYGTVQWSDSDFAPIAKTFDTLFKSIGWLK